MGSVNYKILARAGAGSLIAEFLFREIGVNYEITFVGPKMHADCVLGHFWKIFEI